MFFFLSGHTLFILYVCVCGLVHGMSDDNICSLLTLLGFWGSNSNHQARRQASLPTEPYCQPHD